MKICNSCGEQKELEFFPKSPNCKDGHRNYCKVCHQSRKERWRMENLDDATAKQKLWLSNNPERVLVIKKKWRDANKEYHRLQGKKWREQHPERAKAQVNARRGFLKKAQPQWADTGKIQEFYLIASKLTKETGISHHVDHIIPLLGKQVSGLHVETNLQVIPAHENQVKSNKFYIEE